MKKKGIYLLILTCFLFIFTLNTAAEETIPVEFEFYGYATEYDSTLVQGAVACCRVIINSYDMVVQLEEYVEVYTNANGYYYAYMVIDVPHEYYTFPFDFNIYQDCWCPPNDDFYCTEYDFVSEEIGCKWTDFSGYDPLDDTDNNGFPDDYEILLAQKFAPQLKGHHTPTCIYPEPFRIMGGQYNSNIYASLFIKDSGYRIFNGPCSGNRIKMFHETNGWETILHWAGTNYDYHNECYTNRSKVYCSSEYDVCMQINESFTDTTYWVLAPGEKYEFEYNFDWPGTHPTEWRNIYTNTDQNNPYDGSKYANTIYVTLFKQDTTYAVQYWFFYPYNDWINNHEGDMEHINVAITSPNPNEADIDFVDYYFHHKVDRWTKEELNDYSSIIDNTHPKVFIGGYGYEAHFGQGNNSGGSYPITGYFIGVGAYGANERVDGLGVTIPYTDFSNDGDFYNRQGLELLKSPQYEDYSAHKWLCWNATRIAIGLPTYGWSAAYLLCPYHSGGWRQLGPCGSWQQY